MTFFAAILVLNTVLVTGVAQEWLPAGIFSRGRFYLLALTLASVVLMARGWPAVVDLVRPLTVWRVKPVWFAAAMLLPIVFTVVFLLLKSVVTGTEPVILGSGIEILHRRNLLLSIFISALIGEIVWVGYALRMLRAHMRIELACVITGTVWGLWWLPMLHFGIGIVPNLTFVGLWMNMIGIAFFCAFFYLRTGSGLVILAMQFIFNCATLAFAVIESGPVVYNSFAALYMLAGWCAVRFGLPDAAAPRQGWQRGAAG
jgi:membrane protease YdiL (CAAX protease family)